MAEPKLGVRDNNVSIAPQTINAAITAVLAGSQIVVPTGGLRVGTVFRYKIHISKTAAGTAANAFAFQLGTLGTVGDADILSFALPVGTAAIDNGYIEIIITIRGPLGAACIASGTLCMSHNLSATGLATTPCVVLNVTSGNFNSATAGLIASLVCTTAAATVLTFQQVIAEVLNL